jgi:hypothetical protein
MAKILDISDFLKPMHCNCCKTSLIYEYRRKTNVDERPCTSCIREKI